MGEHPLQCVELSFDGIVGAINKANATAHLLRELDGVTPEEAAMLLQMRYYDVDCVTPVSCRTAVGTAPFERKGKPTHGGTYVFQLGGRVSPAADPPGSRVSWPVWLCQRRNPARASSMSRPRLRPKSRARLRSWLRSFAWRNNARSRSCPCSSRSFPTSLRKWR